jgi:superfamily II DNA/RNA helicase
MKNTEKSERRGSTNRIENQSEIDNHNATPRDVSKNALKWDSLNSIINVTSKIFTRITFHELGLHPFIADLLKNPNNPEKKGFGLPTSTVIQAKAIPLNTNNNHNNVLMKSQTGSGKTLAYLLPVINDLMTISPPIQREDGTRALIIAPTRELCQQISDVLAKLTQCYVRIVSGCITGGEKRKSEKARLRKGVVILVSTPGRLLDHIKLTESFNLTPLKWIIMDEIDRLLDMGKLFSCSSPSFLPSFLSSLFLLLLLFLFLTFFRYLCTRI